MEGVHDNASTFMHQDETTMAKLNGLNQAESLMSASYISQLHGNAHKKTKK